MEATTMPRRAATALLAVLVLCGGARGEEVAKAAVSRVVPTKPKAKGAAHAKTPAKAESESSASWHTRRGLYFKRNWGVDIVGVRRVASGWMLRFDFRVVDPDRAAALTDRKARPYLIDDATGTALAVPAMENVGELRQVAPLEPDRTYFILFGNPGGWVARGGHVTLVIGNFRAEGMVVD